MRRVTQAEVLAALPANPRPLVERVLREARRQGAAVHLVGGPVRDLLLGVAVRDVDLVVEAGVGGLRAEALAGKAAPPGARVVSHGRFGTVRLEGDGAAIDLATARREVYERPGALPTVTDGTLEEDLRRRDFTVNALAIPLTPAAARGREPVVAVEQGLADLEARVLRVLHERSFHDDPTRALRASRLAPRLGFALSRGSRACLRDALRDGAFGAVSGERFRRELEKHFEDAALGLDPAGALGLLHAWHVLGALEPGLHLPRAAATPLRRLGRLLAGPAWPHGRVRPWVPGFALWLAPLERGLRARALRRFAVRGATAGRIVDFPRARDQWLRGVTRARGRGATDACLGALEEEDLHALWASAPSSLRARIARYAAEDRGRRMPVSGETLITLGLSGPAVGRALARIRAAWLDGAVRTPEEALALARELASRQA